MDMMDKSLHKSLCFSFSWYSINENSSAIVKKSDESITLFAVRDLNTGHELSIAELKLNWPKANQFAYQNLAQVIDASRTVNAIDSKGFIICDSQYLRMKVSSPQYNALSKLNPENEGGVNQTLIFEAIRHNMLPPSHPKFFLWYFPKWKELYNVVNQKYEEVCTNVAKYLPTILALDQKDAAAEARKYNFGSIMMNMRFYFMLPLINCDSVI